MRITLDLSDETLACIWGDSWKDKEPESITQRCRNVIERDALRFNRNFPYELPEIVEQFRQSKAAKGMNDTTDDDIPRRDVRQLIDVLNAVWDNAVMFADGAPDANDHDKLCNELMGKIGEVLSLFRAKHPNFAIQTP